MPPPPFLEFLSWVYQLIHLIIDLTNHRSDSHLFEIGFGPLGTSWAPALNDLVGFECDGWWVLFGRKSMVVVDVLEDSSWEEVVGSVGSGAAAIEVEDWRRVIKKMKIKSAIHKSEEQELGFEDWEICEEDLSLAMQLLIVSGNIIRNHPPKDHKRSISINQLHTPNG